MLKLVNKYQNGRNIQYDENTFKQYVKDKGYSRGLLGAYYYPRNSSVSVGTKEHIVKSKDYQEYASKAPKQKSTKQSVNSTKQNDDLFAQYVKDKGYSKGLIGAYYYPRGSSVSVGTKEHIMKSKDYLDYVSKNTKNNSTKKDNKNPKQNPSKKEVNTKNNSSNAKPQTKPQSESQSKPQEKPQDSKQEQKIQSKSNEIEKGSNNTGPSSNKSNSNNDSNVYYTNNTYKRVANSLGLNSKEEVRAYQKKLGVKADGIWGRNTQAAYQRKNQISLDPYYNSFSFNTKVVPPVQERIQPIPEDNIRMGGSPEMIIQKYQAMTPRRMSSNNYVKAVQELEAAGYNNWIQNNNNMDEVQKNQTGGEMPQDDIQSQIVQLVQAAMQGDEQAVQQIQQIQQAAEQGNQEAAQIMELINQVIQQMQGGAPEGQTQVAKQGAKLNYIKKLRGECPEGFEMTYFKVGGKVCKKCQKIKDKVQKNCGGSAVKMHRAGGVMNDILIDMYSKGGSTAFGDRSHTPASANAQGRYGGRKAFNPNGTHQLDQHSKPNKFTAFGDEGKKKPTNSGLTGHHATGKAGRMQNKQSAGTTYKATAFGGDKKKRYHKGTGGVPRSGLRTILGYPKGHGGKTGIGRM